jgi:hypothetical protein
MAEESQRAEFIKMHKNESKREHNTDLESKESDT